MRTKRTPMRRRLLECLGAVGVAILMVLTGLAPAGANPGDTAACDSAPEYDVASDSTGAASANEITSRIWIWREGPLCVKTQLMEGAIEARYSSTTGEILWERVPGAIAYEIFRDGVSVGVHDRLNWYMTDLEPSSSYRLWVRPVDENGDDMSMLGGFVMPAHSPNGQAPAAPITSLSDFLGAPNSDYGNYEPTSESSTEAPTLDSSAPASPHATCAVGGVLIIWRSSLSQCDTLIVETSSFRYSSTTGEILWERVPGAIAYEIFRDGVSVGVHDRLNWYMTDLEPSSSYRLSIRAFDQYGDDMDMVGNFLVPAHSPNGSGGNYL